MVFGNLPVVVLPPRLTVPVLRRLPAYSRVTVYRQGRYRRKMKYRLPSRNYRHIYYRQTELPSDLCLTVYRQTNTGNCRYRQDSTVNTGNHQKSTANTGYRQNSTANTGYRPKRTVSSLLYWMPRDVWRMFFYILYFLVKTFLGFHFGRTLYACVDVWTGSVAHLPPHAHHIMPSVVSRSMSGADSSVGGGSAATTSEEAGPAASSVPSAASPVPKKREVRSLPVCCVGAFFVFPVVVVCMRLLNLDVMEREVTYCPLVYGLFFCFSGGCCLHETAQSRCDEKRSRLPACEERTYPTTITKYRHFSCYRLPTRALPSKNEVPSTVKKLPSCCITAEILPAYFSLTVSVKAVTVRYRNTVYRRKITVVSYYHRHNYRHILVLPFPSR